MTGREAGKKDVDMGLDGTSFLDVIIDYSQHFWVDHSHTKDQQFVII